MWGYNRFGQLGDGTMNNIPVPAQIRSDIAWEAVCPGYSSTIALSSELSPASAVIQILGMNTSLTVNPKESEPVNPKPGQMFQVRMDTAVPEGASPVYQFYYRPGYGTEAWSSTTWQPIQDWSPDNWVSIAFDTPDTYFVTGHVRTEDESWGKGDPQAGFSVVVSDDPGTDPSILPVAAQILGVSSSLLAAPQPDEAFRFAVNAAIHAGTALQYRFYYRAGYGTPAWSFSTWQVLQDWSPNSWADTIFAGPGSYYVVAHVVPEGETWEPGDPQGGFSVRVE